MMKSQRPRVQAQTDFELRISNCALLTLSVRLHFEIRNSKFEIPVQLITDHWMTHMSAMYSELVGAPGDRLQFQKRGALESLDDFEARLCAFPILHYSPMRLQIRIAPDWRTNRSRFPIEVSVHQREISLLD